MRFRLLQSVTVWSCGFLLFLGSVSNAATNGVGLGVQQHATAQVSDAPDCARCVVDLLPVVSLGDDEGAGLIGPMPTVSMAPGGRYLLSYDAADHEIIVFDSSGHFIRTLGRAGDGPNEYTFIRWIRSTDSAIHVFDAFKRRHTVLSPDLAVVRTSVLPGIALEDVVVVGAGEDLIALNSIINSPEHVGFLVHILDEDGTVLRSIAEDAEGYRFDFEAHYRRAMGHADASGEIWVAKRFEYEMQRWNVEGQLLQVVRRQANWFPPPTGLEASPLRTPHVRDIYQSPSGLLWLLVTVSDPEQVVQEEQRDRPEEGRPVVFDDTAFDTLIEVIDPDVGVLVASARTDRFLIQFLEDGSVISYTDESVAGVGARVHVWRPQLVAPGHFNPEEVSHDSP